MEPFLVRLNEEASDLLVKIDKLTGFIESSEIFQNLPESEKSLLTIQLRAMETYYECLIQRLKTK